MRLRQQGENYLVSSLVLRMLSKCHSCGVKIPFQGLSRDNCIKQSSCSNVHVIAMTQSTVEISDVCLGANVLTIHPPEV